MTDFFRCVLGIAVGLVVLDMVVRNFRLPRLQADPPKFMRKDQT